jgi:hypothetical protein
MASHREAPFHAETMLNGLDQAQNKQLEVHFYNEEKELNDLGS